MDTLLKTTGPEEEAEVVGCHYCDSLIHKEDGRRAIVFWCDGCGKPFWNPVIECPDCGDHYQPDEGACGSCGRRFMPSEIAHVTAEADRQQPSWWR